MPGRIFGRVWLKIQHWENEAGHYSQSDDVLAQSAFGVMAMCLILFEWQRHPRYALVLAANRDEFHARPTASAHFWETSPGLLAGRDLQAGGTWLGVTRSGRFAAITNYREPVAPESLHELSRGHLVHDFLAGNESPQRHARHLARQSDRYSGFNLLLGSPGELFYMSNRGAGPSAVDPGNHGLSNHLLDTDWPKVRSGRARLDQLMENEELDPEDLFSLLTDRRLTPGALPENIETSLAPERLSRHYFIVSPIYGTRSSTVLLIEVSGRVLFVEREFGQDGSVRGTREFNFDIKT